jgi:diguanylate cyclase (GGDEF)-like protein
MDQVIEALEGLCASSAADRERAAGDREAAARDREHHSAELDRAHLDDLTGAYRREMGRTTLEHEIERAHRSRGALAFAYVDFDGLKQANDRYGHVAGDALLRDLVASMRAKLRPYDPIVRWGGDEFICTISDADLEEARCRMDEIGNALDEAHPGSSVSVGLATLGEGDTLKTLIDRADAALLEARPAR